MYGVSNANLETHYFDIFGCKRLAQGHNAVD